MTRKFLEEFGLEKKEIDAVLNARGKELQQFKLQLSQKEVEINALRGALNRVCAKMKHSGQAEAYGLRKQLQKEKAARERDQLRFEAIHILSRNDCENIEDILYILQNV